MKKYILPFIFIIIIISLIIFFIINNNKNTQNNTNISGTKLSLNNNNTNNSNLVKEKNNNNNKEYEISSFSTEIKDNSEGRLTNISITCSLLNDTIIVPNQIFSFNEIVGKPTSERGYKEATVIIDGEHEQGIGGGNCQVSSTLYNAALAVPYLEIIERNEHGLPVTYVPEGFDAAVSYDSLDLKFKNTSNKKIKIKMSTDNNIITAKIIEL